MHMPSKSKYTDIIQICNIIIYIHIFNKTNRRRINILGMLNNYEDFQIEICKNKQCKIKRNQPTN